ncbi:hypothetical protein [Streptomyces hygroscopicus]|uniref:hypothetical protein n=1 Tax=Streptomyces hygroscopicus TaxID=1912 RepID=UPI00131B2DEF|nr:hypothetical protein [Streptomyces hygroscopicus]
MWSNTLEILGEADLLPIATVVRLFGFPLFVTPGPLLRFSTACPKPNHHEHRKGRPVRALEAVRDLTVL